MDALSYKTVSANKSTSNKKWVIIDAEQAILGRLSSRVAHMLLGKHKPDFTPNVDTGDNVIIINAEKIRLTGNKLNDKVYTSHTGHPGGQRFKTPRQLLASKPASVIEHAVKGMLPKNRLGRRLFTNLHVYEGTNHPHEAQQPTLVKL